MKAKLDQLYEQYAQSSFIDSDPIQIPHRFSKKQDIEIAGFFASMFAWGRRASIIMSSIKLLGIMENQPYDFILNYSYSKFTQIKDFKHRTFNSSDLDFYIRALQKHYQSFNSLEDAFLIKENTKTIEPNLIHFYSYFSNLVVHEKRNLKHISSPDKNSACKKLCMFLRWMVRKDEIDFGIWSRLNPAQLIMPLDVHVMNRSINLGLIDENEKPSWKTAIKLTEKMRKWDLKDPVKYDLALFGLGVSSIGTNN